MSKPVLCRAGLALVVAACAQLGRSGSAAAGWASLGDASPPVKQENGLLFVTPQGALWVGVENDHAMRVRFVPKAQTFGRDHSYALDPQRPKPSARPQIAVAEARSTMKTRNLGVEISHKPLRLRFFDAEGRPIDQDDEERGIAFAGSTTRVWKTLPDDAHVYGMGEKGGRLDKRGRQLGGTTYAMWNNDTFAYDSDTDPIYVSVPFFMVMRGGRAHGVFLDNTYRSIFDVGHETQRLLSFGVEGGELNYYVIAGPHPKDVVAHYTDLTGRMPLPPRWALGYHQSRWGYWPESRLRLVADAFRSKKIPADVLWLDIDYQDGYKPFTWDKQRFPNPQRMLKELREQGFRVVTIVDPHPPVEEGYGIYDQGLAKSHFVKKADGSLFTGEVWPMRATPPRRSVYPDFTRPSTRAWWASLYKPFLDIGVAGIWNDMNEPAVGDQPNGTMPFDVQHDNEGQPTDHRQVHNVYGQQMSRATFEGLKRARPNERPFVLTRASFAGGQRWSAVWTGDNVSEWSHLRGGIPMLLNMGLSGFAFVGNDIGGFVDNPTPTLFTRWAQAAVFFPFMRAHTTRRSLDQEPWSYGVVNETINRQIIELRYKLLPTIYNEMQRASTTGVPAMRPMLLEFPEDPATWDKDDQFMWGSDILVAPVLREVTLEREVYLPPGAWYAYPSGQYVAAARPAERKANDETALSRTVGQVVTVPVTLTTFPLYVRAGGMVFSHPVVQHMGQLPGQPLEVTVFPAAESSERTLYEDDGETLAYAKGSYCERIFTLSPRGATLTISACKGAYRPKKRDLVVRIPSPAPLTVTAAGNTLQATHDGAFTSVKLPDPRERIEITFR